MPKLCCVESWCPLACPAIWSLFAGDSESKQMELSEKASSWRPSLLGWRPSYYPFASRLEAIASRLGLRNVSHVVVWK